jgi:hypothetical protein
MKLDTTQQLASAGIFCMLITLFVPIATQVTMLDALREFPNLYTPIMLQGFLPPIFILLISIFFKTTPVISSKWFKILVSLASLVSLALLGFLLTGKEIGFYIWGVGVVLVFLSSFYSSKAL